ncbi:hypothetical protein ABZX85_41995 [Streptomyces sp. NPDC004539]|uniref:hypothetical protein n=1 Tax=Streptomyces sp. NPDC004539 TaxID=3154280 RepID=UPI0033AAA984
MPGTDARDDLRRQLNRWRAGGELIDNAELLLTERELRIEVSDSGDGQPELRCAGEGVGKVVWVVLNLAPPKAS